MLSCNMSLDERWLPISGFPGYEVSDAGRVRRGDHIKSLRPPRKGHNSVVLSRAAKNYTRMLGPLVAEAFIGPKPAGMVVRHDNGDGLDDRASNLLYGTAIQNENDKRRHGTAPIGENHPAAKLAESHVRDIRRRYVKGSRANGCVALGAEYGVTPAAVWRLLNNLSWTHVE